MPARVDHLVRYHAPGESLTFQDGGGAVLTSRHALAARAATCLGVALLAVQVAFVVFAHGVQPFASGQGLRSLVGGCSAQPHGCTRYLAWAPNDYDVAYRLDVVAGTRHLTAAEAKARYHLSGPRWEFPVEQLQDLVRRYERSYGRDDHATVVLRYRISGRAEQTWTWHG